MQNTLVTRGPLCKAVSVLSPCPSWGTKWQSQATSSVFLFPGPFGKALCHFTKRGKISFPSKPLLCLHPSPAVQEQA